MFLMASRKSSIKGVITDWERTEDNQASQSLKTTLTIQITMCEHMSKISTIKELYCFYESEEDIPQNITKLLFWTLP